LAGYPLDPPHEPLSQFDHENAGNKLEDQFPA